MSSYRLNALACLALYLACGGVLLSLVSGKATSLALLILAVGIALVVLARLFAVCPQCRKSPLRGFEASTEPAGRYVPYRTWKRDWPEKICSECGRDLTR